MLVLSRHRDETILIGNEVEVKVLTIGTDHVRLGIDAPREVRVDRKEVRQLQLKDGVVCEARPINLGLNYRVNYKIAAQKFSPASNRPIFVLTPYGQYQEIEKTPQEICSDQKIMRGLSPEDAFLIGIAFAQERLLAEKGEMEQAKRNYENNLLKVAEPVASYAVENGVSSETEQDSVES
ncbi:MAG: carbon storage regulator [Proteobacteria bacterium]|nr:carbon storage regulator [Pseudomonadota bacterium]